MVNSRHWVAAVLAVAVAASWPAGAHAEPYAALYAGIALTEAVDLNTSLQITGSPVVNGRLLDMKFDPGAVYGGKVGYFFGKGIVGLEGEAYHFRSTLGEQNAKFNGVIGGVPTNDVLVRVQRADIDITVAALNLLYRVPVFESPEYRFGRLQPYVGGGAAILIGELSTRTSPLDVNQDVHDRDVEPGLQLLAGARYFLTPRLGVFMEYRFLHSQPLDFQFKAQGAIGGVPVTESASDRTKITTHQFVGGFGFHW
jgi:opacity protein-like surface antigen